MLEIPRLKIPVYLQIHRKYPDWAWKIPKSKIPKLRLKTTIIILRLIILIIIIYNALNIS